jgi:hypothetical protein
MSITDGRHSMRGWQTGAGTAAAGFRGRSALLFAGLLAAGALTAPAAYAAPVTLLVYKLGADAAGANSIDSLGHGDLYAAWAASGGFNEGNASAMSLSNSTLDYKNSWADSVANWTSAISIDVGMYQDGIEVAHMVFDPGTDKVAFYSPANLVSTSYTDLSSGSFDGNYFSADGDTGVPRRWFVNQNYGGCPLDTGWFVVADTDSSHPCSWETTRVNDAGRQFLFAEDAIRQNWNNTDGTIGAADVFAITVTLDSEPVPEPGSMGIVATTLAALGLVRRRRRPARS